MPTGVSASVVYNDLVGGAKSWAFAVSPTSGPSRLRPRCRAVPARAGDRATDPVTGAALTATSTPTLAQSQAVRAGMAEVLLEWQPVRHADANRRRPQRCTGAGEQLVARLRRLQPGGRGQGERVCATSRLPTPSTSTPSCRSPGFDTRFVPLHGYFFEAMNAMYARLKDGIALPASQVVRTTPRGGTPGAAPALQAAQVPSMKAAPAAADTIDFSGTTIRVPQ